VKIYVATVEAPMKKGKRASKPDETQNSEFHTPLPIGNVCFLTGLYS
jgi:hypothetical protein